jgi:hypothetical protein
MPLIRHEKIGATLGESLRIPYFCGALRKTLSVANHIRLKVATLGVLLTRCRADGGRLALRGAHPLAGRATACRMERGAIP